VRELAKENSKPIWQHFTANKPARMKVSRKITKRRQKESKKLSDNPLTNVYKRMQKKRSSSRATVTTKIRYKKTPQITKMYKKLGKSRSTSRANPVLIVEEQSIPDRFGDAPE
jgi:(p)ppGpp synthase/HD superfamily hydrolase